MRLVWYAGASTALAASVVVSAFHQRSNFYSAMVHLSQSNLCLMIIINLIYLVYGSFMYCLQRVCFGQLRPVEIEQLYEKAWFAVTETCLAMTIFRGQFGVFFLVMFTSLVTGKVWGWIGEGRIEILEQQPPSNPRLFHTRLSISLILSLIYDVALLHYSVSTVIQQARPDMMVMFLFEFAILTVSSAHTGLRYILSLMEASIVKKQTQQRLEDRRRQIRESNREILRRREAGEATEAEMEEPLPSEDDVDEMDIEVPGWEAKGQWVLSLDLWSDFLKLCIYGAFFTVLLIFYGLPIHIMRDLFLTTRSFIKRLGALMRYRQAVRDMNKYPDATEEELSRENTCIICREEMHIWNPNDATQVERSRPKKLPCGHILHFGCLKSWLERQQVCPTCRRSVAMDGPQGAARNRDAMMFRVGLNFPAGQNQAQPPANGAAPGAQNNAPQAPQAGNGVRMINLGPLRLGFAQGGVEDIQNMAQRLGMPQDVANGAAAPPAATPQPQGQAASLDVTPDAIFAQLREIEQRIQRQTLSLRLAEQETATLRLLLLELQRIRQIQTALDGSAAGTNNTAAPAGAAAVPHAPGLPTMMPPPFIPGVPQPPSAYTQFLPRVNSPSVTRLGVEANAQAIPSGSAELPEGVSIPAGWTLMPLQRLDAHATNSGSSSTANSQAHPGANATSSGSAVGTTSQASASAPEVSNLEAAQNGHRPVSTGASGQESTAASAGFSFNTPREPVQMAQPTPVLPNWGGRAQLFSNETGHLPFGVQQNGADSSTPGTRDRSVDSQARSEAPKAADSPAVHAPPEEGSSNEGSSSEDKGKGKARSVTVEEAEDEDA